MAKPNVWKTDSDWKLRYSQLYSRRLSQPKEESSNRISFMSQDSTPYSTVLMRMRANRDSMGSSSKVESTSSAAKTLLSQRSDLYGSYMNSHRSTSSDRNETLLLDMVRAGNRSNDDTLDKPLLLPQDDISDQSSEACVHGYSMRMTDRSVSRSRVSRMSTRRDMDICSILAFQANPPPPPPPLEIPAFQKLYNPQTAVDIPKWSIRRGVCPVCSQKWRDKSSIKNVKYSGLKRNSTAELPSVIAPARLRAQITQAYVPRPTLPSVDEGLSIHRSMRNTSTSWQLTRARRFRTPKLQMLPPDAIAPPSITAPLARKDLDFRVIRFLKDEGYPKISK